MSNHSPSRVLHTHRFGTPLGEMVAMAVDERLCLLEFHDRHELETEIALLCTRLTAGVVERESAVLTRTAAELGEYFAGSRREFTIPLQIEGTEFQRAVWERLQRIPIGQTRSYAELARDLSNPEATRAVGGANSRNRLAIIIPCHRVIASGGGLGGYAGGLDRKRWLLDHEAQMVSAAPERSLFALA
ncbi:MAG: methylated-DNA--[protein]-cysteine S-methyltransferase [Phycisphaerales bacterium]|nr:methylated-DNA--[protein]-cysteine S-methyltransferase [Phycisphaerales bacterium]